MELEHQVCSLELAKRLKELGVKQKSHFRWVHWNNPNGPALWDDQTIHMITDIPVKTAFGIWDKGIPAFTVAELGEMLPQNRVRTMFYMGIWFCEFFPLNEPLGPAIECFCNASEADARAEMLIYLLENNLM